MEYRLSITYTGAASKVSLILIKNWRAISQLSVLQLFATWLQTFKGPEPNWAPRLDGQAANAFLTPFILPAWSRTEIIPGHGKAGCISGLHDDRHKDEAIRGLCWNHVSFSEELNPHL